MANNYNVDLIKALDLGIFLRTDGMKPFTVLQMQISLKWGWAKAKSYYDEIDKLGYLSPCENEKDKKYVNISIADFEELKKRYGANE